MGQPVLRLRLRFSALTFVTLFLLLPSTAYGLSFGPAETSYQESFTIPPGDSPAASGGRLGYAHVHAVGSLVVRSCCGYSTNDIMFAIVNQYSGGMGFGVVTGTYNFEWDSGNDT